MTPAPTSLGTPAVQGGPGKKVDAIKPVSTPPVKMTEPSDAMPPTGRGGNQKPVKLPDMKTSERPLKDSPPIKQPEMRKAPERLNTPPPPMPSGNGDNGLERNRKADRLNVPQAPRQPR